MNEISFGKNLKMLRERVELTQNDVSIALQISRQSVSKWEQDIALPKLNYVILLCVILNCSLEELVNYQKNN